MKDTKRANKRDCVPYSAGAVRDYRHASGVTAEELARLLDIAITVYYKKETGKIRWTLCEAKFLADYFGRPIEEIFFNERVS